MKNEYQQNYGDGRWLAIKVSVAHSICCKFAIKSYCPTTPPIHA